MIVRTDDTHYKGIANAIRAKLGTTGDYAPSEMAAAVSSIVTAEVGPKTITANGTYAATSDSLDGYSVVTVNVPPRFVHGYATSTMSVGDFAYESSVTR